MGNQRTKSHDDFVGQIHNINSNIIILGKYHKDYSRIQCQCAICGHIWNPICSDLVQGRGCPECAKHIRGKVRKYTQEQITEKIKSLHPNLILIGQYKGTKEYTEFQCTACGTMLRTKPDYLINGRGCRECAKIAASKRMTLSHDVFVKRMKKISPNIEILTEYKAAKLDITCRCEKGHVWTTKPDILLHGYGCPICNLSKGEKIIQNFLLDNNICFETQKRFDDCRDVRSLPFDFYLPDYNICLEYDGRQHIEPVNFGGCSDDVALHSFNHTQKHDKIKDEYCTKNNIQLIRISYKDYNDIEQILKLTLKI